MTDMVAFATKFFFFASRKMRVVAYLRLGFALSDTKKELAVEFLLK